MLFDSLRYIFSFSHFIVALFILLVAIIVYFIKRLSATELEKTKFFKIMLLIGGLASVFIALGLYHDAKVQEDIQLRQLKFSTIQVVKEEWVDPHEKLLQHYNSLKEMINELYPELDIKSKADFEKVLFAMHVLQLFENYRTIYSEDMTGLDVWLRVFLNWSRSKTLREIWPKLKLYYKKSTMEFCYILIGAAKQMEIIQKKNGGVLTDEDIEMMVEKIKPGVKKILVEMEISY